MLRTLVNRALLVLASGLLGLLVAEAALRVAGVSYPSFFVVDENRGLALRPGAKGWQHSEGRAFVRINSRGLRDREHPLEKPPASYRIAVLGDSYAQASQVAADRTFWAVLERELGGCSGLEGRTPEAINFGVSGYGTTEQLLTFRHHVRDYSPDLVVLAFFAGNDVADNARSLSRQDLTPYFLLEDDRLVLDDSFLHTPAYRFRTSLLGRAFYSAVNHVRVLQVVNRARVAIVSRARRRAQKAYLRTGPAAIEAGINAAVYREPETPEWTNAWAVTERLLTILRDEVEASGSKFLLVTLTTGVQVHPDPDLRSEFVTGLGIDDIFYPDERIRGLAQRSGMAALILGPDLQRFAVENQVLLHGFDNAQPGFGHWNERGHEQAGKTIARRICESLERPGL